MKPKAKRFCLLIRLVMWSLPTVLSSLEFDKEQAPLIKACRIFRWTCSILSFLFSKLVRLILWLVGIRSHRSLRSILISSTLCCFFSIPLYFLSKYPHFYLLVYPHPYLLLHFFLSLHTLPTSISLGRVIKTYATGVCWRSAMKWPKPSHLKQQPTTEHQCNWQ